MSWMEEVANAPTEDSLAVIARTVSALDSVVADLEGLREKLKASEEQQKILKGNLADILSKHGMTALKLTDGRKLTLSEELKVSLPADPANRFVVLQFIEQNGGKDIIKDEVILRDPSEGLMNALIERGEDFDRKFTVHPQTLAAFFREKLGMSKGIGPSINPSDVPREAGLFLYKNVSIK